MDHGYPVGYLKDVFFFSQSFLLLLMSLFPNPSLLSPLVAVAALE